jgi:hypothetical protein
MGILLLTVTISCTQVVNIIHRITKVVGLTDTQKSEIIQEIRKSVPFCPVIIKKDD